PGETTASSSTPVGGAVNKLGLFNQAMRANKVYTRLVSMCSSKWNTKYTKRKKSDPDTSVAEYAVDKEVERRKAEGWKVWDAMYAKAGAAVAYEVDYYVSTVKRGVGEEIKGVCLIKFTKYPVPSWEEPEGIRNMMNSFRSRCFNLDFIEIRVRTEIGDAEFERLFPNRYLTEEKGDGNGGYVKNKRSLYHNDLRALESRWAYICARAGLPILYIEDWTNEPFDFESLKLLKFIIHLVNSPSVEKFIKDYDQLKDMTCDSSCSNCFSKLRTPLHKHCCGISESVDIDENTGDFKWCEKGKPHRLEHCMHFECTEKCACKEKECKNRPLQRGRQHVLCIFREP
ncbi:hypothetical protein PENTCL1PPCAC_3040, partial [Pristionchus entomophagus]